MKTFVAAACSSRHTTAEAGKACRSPLSSLTGLLLLSTLAACSGGGGSSDSDGVPPDDATNTSEPPPTNDGDTVVDDDDDDLGGGLTPPVGGSFTFSGELTANDVFQSDSDVNDPFTTATDNNSLAAAQPIGNPTIVKGYVTATPTGVASDRFETTADEFDVFRITAFENQSVLLEIANFDSDNPSDVDLDVGLFDLDGNLLEASLSVSNSFEAVLIPADGDYYIAVNAFSGSSNYTMSVSVEFGTTAFDTQVSLSNVRQDKLTLARSPHTEEGVDFVSAMSSGLPETRAATSPSGNTVLGLDKKSMTRYFDARQTARAGVGGDPVSLMSLHSALGGLARTGGETGTESSVSMLKLVKSINSVEGADVLAPMAYPVAYQAFDSDPVPDRFLQWNLYDIGWSDAVDQLQEITLQKRPIIAVIDSGLVVDHPDVQGALIDQRDFVAAEFDGDGFVADASTDVQPDDAPECQVFHGTHTSTTATAPQNNTGITGVAAGAGLIAIKIGHSTGADCAFLVGNAAEAVLYAAGLPNASGALPSTPADVINMSLGSRDPDPVLASAIQRAAAQGVIIVAAAGNDGAPIRSYPAAQPNVIAVGATDLANDHAFYSSFYPEVDIAAPGGDTNADLNADGVPDGVLAGIAALDGNEFQPAWGLLIGTSMASPTVAGGLALMKAIEPSLTQGDIEAMLAAGDLTVDIGDPGFDNQTGYGLMSLPRMIASAQQFTGSDQTGATGVITSSPDSLDFGAGLDEITLELVQLGDDGRTVESVAGSDSLELADGTFPIAFTGPDTADGFGNYTFVLNRDALESGSLSGSISFTISDGSIYEVFVSAVNQIAQGDADSSAVFFIVERVNDEGELEDLDAQFFAPDGVRGDVPASPALPAGSYRVIFGTDMDNDLLICDEGELCGVFPADSFNFDSFFELNEDLSGITYSLQDVASIALTAFDGTDLPPIGARRIDKAALSAPVK